MLNRLGDGQFQHIGNGLALVLHLQRGLVETTPITFVAFNVDIREEVHLDFPDPVTLAILAATTLHIEREPARLVSPHS